MEQVKRTGLYNSHLQLGAVMSSFGGYEMPLWYKGGVRNEHLSVIRAAGLFDTSHMAGVGLAGRDARLLLQRCFSSDLDSGGGKKKKPLSSGGCRYGLFLREDGTVLDDAIVYQLQEELFLVIVNASMGKKVADHLQQYKGALLLDIEELTDRFGKIDLQGVNSARILQEILREPVTIFQHFPYFTAKGGFSRYQTSGTVILDDSTELLLSRTGYTGEFGFEIFVEPSALIPLWDKLLWAGEELGLTPCGLAARDSLRTGAVLPLSHQDIGPRPFINTPWDFALPLEGGLAAGNAPPVFSKDFIGGEALKAVGWSRYIVPFAGFDPRKITISEESCVVAGSGRVIGEILTCTTDMAMERQGGAIIRADIAGELKLKGLSCGFVLLYERCGYGDLVWLKSGKRKIEVELRRDLRPQRTARLPVKKMLGKPVFSKKEGGE